MDKLRIAITHGASTPEGDACLIQPILSTLLHVILPLSIPVAAGALLVRFRRLETSHLLTLVLYFLTPMLIFRTLLTAQLSAGDVRDAFFFSMLNLVVMWALAAISSRLLRLSTHEAAGLSLVATLTNSVNYGLPLVLLAYGTAGLDKASVYVVLQMIIVHTFGVYFAARSHFSVRDAIRSVFALPSLYAALLAVALRMAKWQLPAGLDQGVAMVASAYSPVVLVVLGAQMARVGQNSKGRSLGTASWVGLALRALVSPLAAWACLAILGITGTAFSVLLILASMPVAVNAVILAEKFDAAPGMVSRCILWTTLLSFFMLPVLITLLRTFVA